MSNNPEVHINPMTSLTPAIKAWEFYLLDQGKSVYTVKAFLGDLELLTRYLPPDRTIGSITTADLNQFLAWLTGGRGIPCSPKSLSRRITSIKSFFRWLHSGGRILVDPAEKVVQQSVISPLPEILTEEEQAKLLDTASEMRTAVKPDPRPYLLYTLLISTGIKKGECLAIHLNHIDLESPDAPFLFVRYANAASRYKERKIRLTADWVQAYQEYLQRYKPVDTLFPWSPRRLEYILEDLGKDAGLQQHVSFDMCRWSCAVNDWKSGMDPEALRQKLGISKIQWREIQMKIRQLVGEKTA